MEKAKNLFKDKKSLLYVGLATVAGVSLYYLFGG